MRVIDQAHLAFREGTSDKVYEIDLVEVATGQYVVNFRFGRRGTALKDGTKTPTPVSAAKGRSIFDKLIAEKLAGGYKRGGRDDDDDDDDDDDERTFDVVARLRQGHRGDGPLGPVVWKATDRDLRDAEPALLELLDAPGPADVPVHAWRFTVIAALARCGTTTALPRLQAIADDVHERRHLRDAARLALVRIEPGRAERLGRVAFTPAIATAYDAGDAGALARALDELLATDPPRGHAVVTGLYLLAGEPPDSGRTLAPREAAARTAVFAAVRVARLTTAEAATVRTLFRFAEMRRDGELYVHCAKRIDAHSVGLRPGDSGQPFGERTRQYLRRRTARVLRRLGRAGSPDYVKMAAAWVIAYADTDADEARRGRFGTWYDRFARFHTLNQILFSNSPRYARGPHQRSAWHCAGRYRPEPDGRASQREEAFPALWDHAPAQLWQVIARTRAAPAAEFAVRALRENATYFSSITDDQLADVLARGHAISQELALELAQQRPMTAALARGGLASSLPAAHAWVLRWVAANQAAALADAEILALLVTGRTPQVREAGLDLLRARPLTPELARSVAARALAILLALGDSADDAAQAAGAVAVLLRVLDEPLREVGAEVLRDLIAHPLGALGELAGELMLRHAHREQLPHALLEALLTSPHASVRAIGSRLVAMTPAEVARDDLDALEMFATSGNRELREGTRTLIGEVARRDPEVARQLATRLVHALLRTQPEGAPAHIVSLLRSELADVLPRMPVETVLKLVGALSPHAREVGGLLLPLLGPDDVGLDDIARLAGNEVLAIRQGAWALARSAVPRYRLAPLAIARLVDSAWEDSRAFAIELVRSELSERLSADAIIAICDSIRPEVQALGKSLLHERFVEADAGRYLVRLAEHPSPNLQLLVSGLLEHHVRDLDQLRAVVPYLQTVLSLVNRGGVAKLRVLALLRREATRSAEAAAVLAPLLDRQSATIAVTQKAPLIATMVDVHDAYPEVELPIAVVPPAPHPQHRGES